MQGLAEADVGLFVIDARGGITPADQELADELRRQDKPILLVANKCEGRLAEAQVGRGLVAWAWASRCRSRPSMATASPTCWRRSQPYLGRARAEPAEAADQAPTGAPLRLAVIGRPNAGKSSLVNRLIDEERLLTGPEPGLTRDSVTIAADLAGPRRSSWSTRRACAARPRSTAKLEKLSTSATLRALKFAEVVALVVDATMPLERQDLTIARLVAAGRPGAGRRAQQMGPDRGPQRGDGRDPPRARPASWPTSGACPASRSRP